MKPIQPDAHLRTALHHAPDATLQAPADLSARIVAAAHRATAEAPARPARPAHSWWPWRGTWRIGASGAFASLLMAGVIGLLWRDETPGPVREEAAPAAAVPVAEGAAALPVPVAEIKAGQGAVVQATSATSAPPPQVAPVPPSTKLAQAPRPARAAAPPAPAAVAAPPPEPPPVIERAAIDAGLQRERRTMDNTPATAPVLEAARSAAGPAASLSLSGSRLAVGSTGGQGAGSGMNTALAPAVGQARPAPPAPWPGPGAMAEAGLQTLFMPGRARVADPALLQAVWRHTAGRWAADASAQPQAAENALEWRQGDQVLGRLWLGGQRALLCPPPGVQAPCQVANLSPPAAAALEEQLPR